MIQSREISCRSCGKTPLTRIVELGNLPPVNGFLTQNEVLREGKFPMNMAVCPRCALVQLEDVIPPENLFQHYLHLSSGSKENIAHLKSVAELIQKRFRFSSKPKILEIGSNDGTLLSFLKKDSAKVLGVDPAENLKDECTKKNVECLTEFFGFSLAQEIKKKRGPMDLIVALNVVAHTPDFIDLLKGVVDLLPSDGYFLMEAAYFLNTLKKGQFDTLYHEHVYCFSLHSLKYAFYEVGLKIIDAEMIPTQGSSLRIMAVRQSNPEVPSPNIGKILKEEQSQGLTDASSLSNISNLIDGFKTKVRGLVDQLKSDHGRLIGLGAPARGVVVMNVCGFGGDDFEFVVDDTPLKQGRLMPGVHVPVRSWSHLSDEKKAYFLLSWNYKEALLKRLREMKAKGSVLIPFPQLEVISL